MNTHALELLFPQLLIVAIFWFIPVYRRERAFFGVPVSAQFYAESGRVILHRYRVALSAAYLALFLLEFALWSWRKTPVAVVAVAPFVSMIFYALAYRAVAPYWQKPDRRSVASSLAPRRLSDYTHIAIELFVWVITLLPVLAVFFYSEQMPARIPIHWNLFSQPDRWVTKSVGAVALVPALGLWVQALALLIKNDLVKSKMPLPASAAEEFLRGKQRQLLIAMRMFDWMRVFAGVLLFCAAMLPLASAVASLRPLERTIGVLLPISGLLLLLGLVFFGARWFFLQRRMDARCGRARIERGDESEHWYGGLIYFNPGDPAFVVEKLEGLGYTINFARGRAWFYILLIAVLPGLLIWAGAS
ncbi:MAG: DUF1648 domain-containing protein [Verrucomicrobiota bacterium]|nr:DUF1648 domain-containing protein [Verrucomicrobiota bacterium]